MNLFTKSWQFTKSSFTFLKANLDLFWISLISLSLFICFLLVSIFGFGILAPLFSTTPISDLKPFTFIIEAFAVLLILSFLMLFSNVWLTACITMRLKGEPCTLSGGLKLSMSRLPSIIGWAFMSSTVGVLLQTLEQSHNFFARIIGNLLNVAWALAAYFVLPIIIFNKIGPIKAIKLSSEKFGTSIRIRVGISLISLLIIMPGVPLYYVITAIIHHHLAWPKSIEISVITVLGILIVAALYINQMFQMIIRSALYLFFINNSTPDGFDPNLLNSAAVTTTKKKW